MKINQDVRVKIENVRNEQKQPANSQVRFGEIIQKQDKQLKMDHIERLLSRIEEAGQRLDRSRTLKDLAKYKGLVKSFIQETIDFGMGLKKSQTWNQFGQTRTLKIVETIDEKLVELTDELINKEKNGIDLLDKLGEIKGLLINLYT